MQTVQLTHAFHWLDKHMAEALDCPDEHLDWIYMLRAALLTRLSGDR